jgi:recombinational DNA repair protein (RecF pathway)
MLKKLILALETLVEEIKRHNDLYENMLSQMQSERNKAAERVSATVLEILNKAGVKL